MRVGDSGEGGRRVCVCGTAGRGAGCLYVAGRGGLGEREAYTRVWG